VSDLDGRWLALLVAGAAVGVAGMGTVVQRGSQVRVGPRLRGTPREFVVDASVAGRPALWDWQPFEIPKGDSLRREILDHVRSYGLNKNPDGWAGWAEAIRAVRSRFHRDGDVGRDSHRHATATVVFETLVAGYDRHLPIAWSNGGNPHSYMGSPVRVGPRLRSVATVEAERSPRIEREAARILSNFRFAAKTRSPNMKHKFLWIRVDDGIERWSPIGGMPANDPIVRDPIFDPGGAELSSVTVERYPLRKRGDWRYAVYDTLGSEGRQLGVTRRLTEALELAAYRMAEISVEHNLDPGQHEGSSSTQREGSSSTLSASGSSQGPSGTRPKAKGHRPLPQGGSRGSPVRVGPRFSNIPPEPGSVIEVFSKIVDSARWHGQCMAEVRDARIAMFPEQAQRDAEIGDLHEATRIAMEMLNSEEKIRMFLRLTEEQERLPESVRKVAAKEKRHVDAWSRHGDQGREPLRQDLLTGVFGRQDEGDVLALLLMNMLTALPGNNNRALMLSRYVAVVGLWNKTSQVVWDRTTKSVKKLNVRGFGSAVRVGPRFRQPVLAEEQVERPALSVEHVWRTITDSALWHGKLSDPEMRVGDLELALGLAIEELKGEPQVRWFLGKVAEGRIPDDIPGRWTPRSIHDAAARLVKRAGWWASRPQGDSRRKLLEELTSGGQVVSGLEAVLAWALDTLSSGQRRKVLERYARDVSLWNEEGQVEDDGAGGSGSLVRVGPRFRAAAEGVMNRAVVRGLVPPVGRTGQSVPPDAPWIPVRVEVDLLVRLPRTVIVGLPQNEVHETIERVRSAIDHAGFEMPQTRIVVNLAPADIKKRGGWTDLPIAVGILLASGQIPRSWAIQEEVTFVGRFASAEEQYNFNQAPDWIQSPTASILTEAGHGTIVTNSGPATPTGWLFAGLTYLSGIGALMRRLGAK
jgi:hypothetical protein